MRFAAHKELEEIESMMKELELMEGGDGPDGFGTLLDDFVVTATDVRTSPPPKPVVVVGGPRVPTVPEFPPSVWVHYFVCRAQLCNSRRGGFESKNSPVLDAIDWS